MHTLGLSISEVTERFRPKTNEELDADYDLLTVSSDGKITIKDSVKGEDLEGANKIVHAGDIAFNPMRANIGSIALIGNEFDGGLISPDYRIVRASGIDPEYLVSLLRTPFYKMYIDIMTTGSIRDRLYPSHLQSMLFPKSKVAQQKSIKSLQRDVDKMWSKLSEDLSHLEGSLNASIRSMFAG